MWALPFLFHRHILTMHSEYPQLNNLEKRLYEYGYKIANVKKDKNGTFFSVVIPVRQIYDKFGSSMDFKSFHRKIKRLVGNTTYKLLNLDLTYIQKKRALRVIRNND